MLCLHYHNYNIIVFLLNTALFLKVKHRYVYQLAKVAIIRLNTKK